MRELASSSIILRASAWKWWFKRNVYIYALGNVNKKTEEDTKKLCFTHNMNTEKLVGCSYKL